MNYCTLIITPFIPTSTRLWIFWKDQLDISCSVLLSIGTIQTDHPWAMLKMTSLLLWWQPLDKWLTFFIDHDQPWTNVKCFKRTVYFGNPWINVQWMTLLVYFWPPLERCEMLQVYSSFFTTSETVCIALGKEILN